VAAEGAAAEGAAIEGTATESTVTEGVAIEGAAAKGEAAEGAATKGAATKGAAIEGAAIEGAAIEGTAAEGVAVEGAAAEDEAAGALSGAGESPLRPAKVSRLVLSAHRDRVMSSETALTQLELKEIHTPSFNFNCLAFGCMLSISGGIVATNQESSTERRLSHEKLLKQLPAEADNDSEVYKGLGNDGQTWFFGYDKERLIRIFTERDFMGEAHVCAFAERLQRDIFVLDTRFMQIAIMHYKPAFAKSTQISMHKAKEIRQASQSNLQQPIWLRLHEGHYRALLPALPELLSR
jgi:hypothetical protein